MIPRPRQKVPRYTERACIRGKRRLKRIANDSIKESDVRRRLYFLLPDVASAERTVDDLLLARVEDRHLHVLARRGTDLGNLREASALQKTDLIHGAEIGMMVGGVGGL